jgi:hypothetical protein
MALRAVGSVEGAKEASSAMSYAHKTRDWTSLMIVQSPRGLGSGGAVVARVPTVFISPSQNVLLPKNIEGVESRNRRRRVRKLPTAPEFIAN